MKECKYTSYRYLLSLEDRRTYQCYPSYTTIGKAVELHR